MKLLSTARPDRSVTRFRRFFLSEPLVHFLVLGAALFLYEHWTTAGPRSASNQIVITSGQIEHLLAGFTKAWKRSPSEAELKGIIDDFVREELAVRAATEAGLDRGDSVIRRRLRQKFEFLVEDVAEASDRQLETWFAENAERYRTESRLRFRQVFFGKQRGGTAHTDAAAALERLALQNWAHPIDDLGDASLLPGNVGLASMHDINQMFGEVFANQILRIAPGTWSGPVESSYGLHLVFVAERVESFIPDLATIRPAVERDYETARRREQIDSIYERLLEKFTVVIEGSESRTFAPNARKGSW